MIAVDAADEDCAARQMINVQFEILWRTIADCVAFIARATARIWSRRKWRIRRFWWERAFGFAGKPGRETTAQISEQTRTGIVFIAGNAIPNHNNVREYD